MITSHHIRPATLWTKCNIIVKVYSNTLIIQNDWLFNSDISYSFSINVRLNIGANWLLKRLTLGDQELNLWCYFSGFQSGNIEGLQDYFY